LKTFALEILNRTSEKRVISDVEKFIIILDILKNIKSDEQFRYTLSGMALAISHFIKDIKISTEDLISFEEIRKELNSFEWRFNYNRSIVLFAVDVMEEYIDYMERHKLIDMEDIYKEVLGYVGDLKFDKVIFEGFCEIPRYQRRFIRALINNTPSVVVSFSYDKDVSIDVKELILDDTYLFLKSICNWKEQQFEKEFREPVVECYNFSTQVEEVKGIVCLISEKLRKHKGWTLNDIMTVFPSMLSYRNVVQRIFERYNIPCEILPGYSLIYETSISTFLEFFAFKNSYDWGTLMNILTCPYFTKLDLKETEGFSKSSRERFDKVGFLREDFNLLRGNNINIVKDILQRITLTNKSLKEWIEDIEFIIEKLGWEPSYPEIKVRFQKVLYEMKRDISCSDNEFVNILKKAFELVDVEEGRGSGIKVSGVQESVGISKKLCIIGGATDENIPTAPSLEEVFIPDTLKKQMNFTYYDLRMARERLDLYRLKNENDAVIFTYPSKIQDRNQMKSIFLFNINDSVLYPDIFISSSLEIFAPSFSIEKFRQKFIIDGRLSMRVTQLESLLKCPYSFYLREVEEIKPYQIPEIGEVPDLWGNIIHSVMDELFSSYKTKTINQEDVEYLVKSFKEKLRERIEIEYQKEKISQFYKNIMLNRSEEVCNKFSYIIMAHTGNRFIDSEIKIDGELSSLYIRGRIDHIEQTPEGKIIIVDVKTGTAIQLTYTENNFFNEYNLQIPLYIWMYSRKFNIPMQNIIGNIWRFDFVEKEEKEYEKYYEEKKLTYLEKIEGFLEVIATKILKGEFNFLPERPLNCYFCNYKGLCPYARD
ncbi:MAG: PD-(D/E)XK nuclease family protein, partial [Candidatus Omnitrophica bacterium]|nr:PD-(D/E)XK nuclease family protein [Candidatus Omnitrophota bacterium]